MTAEKYCRTHDPIATHDYYESYIHGIEYGVEDYVYVSESVQEHYCGPRSWCFHRLILHTDLNGEQYFNLTQRDFDGTKHTQRRAVSAYIRIGAYLNPITSEEALV